MDAIARAQTLVIKVGSSLLATISGGLDTAFISRLAGQIATLHGEGKTIILVSSGAVAAGTGTLGLASRPSELPLIQAAAAIGQVALMQIYRQLFKYVNKACNILGSVIGKTVGIKFFSA